MQLQCVLAFCTPCTGCFPNGASVPLALVCHPVLKCNHWFAWWVGWVHLGPMGSCSSLACYPIVTPASALLVSPSIGCHIAGWFRPVHIVSQVCPASLVSP